MTIYIFSKNINLSVPGFAKFILVGGSATLLHYVLAAILISTGWLSPIVASGIGFTISAIFNYFASANFTFVGNHRHLVTVPKFAVTAGIGLFINTVVIFFLGSLGLSFYLSQLLATGFTILWNYAINALWTFR